MLLLFWRSVVTVGTADAHVRSYGRALVGYEQSVTISASSRTTLAGVRGGRSGAAVHSTTQTLVSATSIELQVVWPIADLLDGSWTNELGSTVNLYASIDEGSPSDADYIQSSLSPPTPDEVKLRLGALDNPNINSNHTLRYRYRKDMLGSDPIDLMVRLYRADGVTVLAERLHRNIDSVEDGVLTLSTAQAVVIPSAEYTTGLVVGFSARTPPPFDPTSVPDLVLWLDAEFGAYTDVAMTTSATIDGATVRALKDLSGQGHHALENPTAPSDPIYRTNVYNGAPTIRFSDQYLTWNTDDAWLAQPLTLFFAMKGPLLDSLTFAFASTGAQHVQIRDLGSFVVVVRPDPPSVGMPLGFFVDPPAMTLWRVTMDVTVPLAVSQDGAPPSETLDPVGVFTPSGNPTVLGADASYLHPGAIDLCALVAYHRILTDAEIAEVQVYLADRFGITLS